MLDKQSFNVPETARQVYASNVAALKQALKDHWEFPLAGRPDRQADERGDDTGRV